MTISSKQQTKLLIKYNPSIPELSSNPGPLNIVVYGGSFSPVHKGHMAVARGVLRNDMADEVWIMPCRRNPLKDGSELWDDERRIWLIEQGIEYFGDDRIKLTLQELEMPSPSYTFNTFQALMQKFPEDKFRLLVGADSYHNFNEWYQWEWLERNLSPIVYPRPGYEIHNLRPEWMLLEGVEQFDISSSKIRKMMAVGMPVSDFIPWIS